LSGVITWLQGIVQLLNTTYSDIVTCNCHLLAPSRNCMSHHPALTATAAKIIHKTMQLCLTSC
jgi:hypothetical protein